MPLATETANELRALRALAALGRKPVSMFTGRQYGGWAPLKRCLAAGLVRYLPDQTFTSGADPLVEITDQGLEALRQYSAKKRDYLARPVRSHPTSNTEAPHVR